MSTLSCPNIGSDDTIDENCNSQALCGSSTFSVIDVASIGMATPKMMQKRKGDDNIAFSAAKRFSVIFSLLVIIIIAIKVTIIITTITITIVIIIITNNNYNINNNISVNNNNNNNIRNNISNDSIISIYSSRLQYFCWHYCKGSNAGECIVYGTVRTQRTCIIRLL